MPIADRRDIAHSWATERAIRVWAVFADDIDPVDWVALGDGLARARADGAHVVLVCRKPAALSPSVRANADAAVASPAPPDAHALFDALDTAGSGSLMDVRRLGVVGASVAALEAGHRAGAAAIVGVASPRGSERGALLAGQPDVIVDAAGFGDLDAERYASRRAHRERVLLNPGPTVVSDRVHRAIGGVDLCHREPEYRNIFERVRGHLLQVAGVPEGWDAVLLAGSGTAAMEAMVGASVRDGGRLLVVRNGTYGDRLARIADAVGIEHVDITAGQVRPVDPAAIAVALDADPSIDAVAVVHHETTTGLLNPVAEIAAVTKARDVRLAVDAISAFGAEELPLAAGGIDFVAGTANKCLHGLPGVAFVILSPAAIERARAVRPRSVYLDLGAYLTAAARGSVPFTPSVPAVYALDAALEELLDEGISERPVHYRRRMEFLDEALAGIGLEPVVGPQHRSASVRAYPLPSGISYPELHDGLKQAGYVIYAGQGEAAASQFRVCVLGTIGIEALRGFVATLEDILAGRVTPATLVAYP